MTYCCKCLIKFYRMMNNLVEKLRNEMLRSGFLKPIIRRQLDYEMEIKNQTVIQNCHQQNSQQDKNTAHQENNEDTFRFEMSFDPKGFQRESLQPSTSSNRLSPHEFQRYVSEGRFIQQNPSVPNFGDPIESISVKVPFLTDKSNQSLLELLQIQIPKQVRKELSPQEQPLLQHSDQKEQTMYYSPNNLMKIPEIAQSIRSQEEIDVFYSIVISQKSQAQN